MKLSSFIHQTTITSMNTPIWNIMHINNQASAEVNSFLIAAHILTNLIVSQQFDLFCVIWNEDVKHHIIFNPKVAEK